MDNKLSFFNTISPFITGEVSSAGKPSSLRPTQGPGFLDAFRSIARGETFTAKANNNDFVLKDFPLQLSKSKNGSGPACLSMIFKYFKQSNINTDNLSFPKQCGASSKMLREFANNNGFTSREVNDGNIDLLKDLGTKNISVMVNGSFIPSNCKDVSDYFSNSANDQWVVVTGVKQTDQGPYVYFNDSNYLTPRCLSVEEFSYFWSNNSIAGFSNQCLALAPKGAYPEEYELLKTLPNDILSPADKTKLDLIHKIEKSLCSAVGLTDLDTALPALLNNAQSLLGNKLSGELSAFLS